MYVSLNISAHSIKALSLSGRKVKQWRMLPLEKGLVRDGLILQPAAVGQAVDALLKDMDVPRNRVIATVAGLSFTYRFLALPRMKPARLREAVLRAMKQEISLPPEDLYLSWQAVSVEQDEPTYFVLGVPRSLIDPVAETLKVARVEPYLMDIRPLALARAANRGEAIVVNMDTDSFDIVFVTRGTPAVIRNISSGSEGATLEDNIRRLGDEITKMAVFFRSSHPDNGLGEATPLLLTGELAAEAPAIGLLQTEVPYPVELLVPPAELPPGFPAGSYGVDIGLAMKKTPPKPPPDDGSPRFRDINLNVLSDRKPRPVARKESRSAARIYFLMAVAAVLAIPLFLVTAGIREDVTGLREQLNLLNREVSLANLAAEEAALQETSLQEILARVESFRTINRDILNAREEVPRRLGMIDAALPPDMLFNTYSIDGDGISVRGGAPDESRVISYALALEALGEFAGVRIIEITPGGSGGAVSFEIIVKP